jgi:hypothetical protein
MRLENALPDGARSAASLLSATAAGLFTPSSLNAARGWVSRLFGTALRVDTRQAFGVRPSWGVREQAIGMGGDCLPVAVLDSLKGRVGK